MNAVAYGRFETSEAEDAATNGGLRRLAKTTGLLYLVLAVVGIFSFMVLESVTAHGDAAATARNVLDAIHVFEISMVGWVVIIALDAIVAVMLYVLLEPVSRALSLVSAAMRLVYTVILGSYLINLYTAYSLLTGVGPGPGSATPDAQVLAASAIETFGAGFLLALVFFGMHLIVLGVLLHRSRYVPRVFGILLVAAGVGYIIDSFASFFVAGHGGIASAILVTPAVLGEFGLTFWLIFKGVSAKAQGFSNGAPAEVN